MNRIRQSVLEMESALASGVGGLESQGHLQSAREHLKCAIMIACEMAPTTPMESFSDLISFAANANKGRRDSAILVVRALSVDGLLPFREEHHLERKVATLVEAGFGDQCGNLKLADKRQTYEKIDALKGLHATICSNLRVLKELPQTLAEIDGVKEDIQRALRQGQCQAYLQPFDWTVLKGKITTVCEQIASLVSCHDTTYKAHFDQLSQMCLDLKGAANANPSFLTREYVAPFVDTIERALEKLRSGAIDQFTCTIEPRRKPPLAAEKRYPLHQVSKLLTITVPLVNNGPGIAIDTTAELDCGKSTSLLLECEEIRLGDIPPGEFAVSFKAIVVEPAKTVDMAVLLSW